MNKVSELKQELANLKQEMRSLLENDKVGEAEAKKEEAQLLKTKIDLLEELEDEDQRNIDQKIDKQQRNNQQKVEVRSLFTKEIKGKATQEERALLQTGEGEDGGYLVPQEIKTEINELRRQYKSAKALVDVVPTSTKSGSFATEDLSTMTDLVNFDDDNTGLAEQQPKFRNVEYSVKSYGAVTPISNTLLQDETGNLLSYVNRHFSKKAVRTENKRIFSVLKEKTAVPLAATAGDLGELKDLKNKSLDPSIADSAVWIVNQDVFAWLDQQLIGDGIPALQADSTNATQKRLFGLEVHVFSNNELPTVDDKAPMFLGNFVESVKFFDRGVYEIKLSEHAGFNKNQTVARVIERFDVATADTDAYIHASLDLGE